MSDLARMLQAHDLEIWADGEPDDPESDVVGGTLRMLDGMSADFKAIGPHLDAQSANGKAANEQLAALNKSVVLLNQSMALVLSAHMEMRKELVAIKRALQAPKRLIKDKDGKPIGVEVKT